MNHEESKEAKERRLINFYKEKKITFLNENFVSDNNELVECHNNSDCVFAETACGCANMGSRYPINKIYKKEFTKTNYYNDLIGDMCLYAFSDSAECNSATVCRNEKCVYEVSLYDLCRSHISISLDRALFESYCQDVKIVY